MNLDDVKLYFCIVEGVNKMNYQDKLFIYIANVAKHIYVNVCLQKLFFFAIFIGLSIESVSQNNDNQLALQYYSQGEFEKAANIYQDLFKETHSQTHFDYLISCYQELKDNEKAEKITKDQVNRFPKSYYYQVKLATIYQSNGERKEASDIFDKIIKKSTKELESTLSAGKACLDNKIDSIAQIIYENGHSKYPDNVEIVEQLSTIYLQIGENEKLANTYVSLLENNNEEIQFIENQLQFTLYEHSNPKLKSILYDKIGAVVQKDAKNLIFKELYLWLLTQDKNFEKAFIISKEIDIANDEDGDRVYNLGKIALANNSYVVATDCFSYIVKQGPNNELYDAALKNLLETSYNKLFKSDKAPDLQQIKQLKQEYIQSLEMLSDITSKADVSRNLAHIQAFYLEESDDAIKLLSQMTKDPNYRSNKGKLEMELANIYLFNGDVWSSNMLYASVAMNYKNSDLGHEAQLNQARIAYYNGNFSYAQALLDVLKGSTSKLISNDAFELFQIISDNTALDTSTTAMEIFARGDLLLMRNLYTDASACYDSIPKLFPGHTLEDEILMRKASIAKAQNNETAMISYLQEIEDRFSYDIFADKAIFSLAEYYEKQNDIEKAREKYKKLLFDYPNSMYSQTARTKYRELEKK